MRAFVLFVIAGATAGASVGCGGAAPRAATVPPAEVAAAEAPPVEAPKAGDEPATADELPARGDAMCSAHSDMFGPYSLSEAQASQRYGKNARTFADAPSTKDQAIEVCGIPASRQWLRGTACVDGSTARQNGRLGSVGPGGRCGSIIDHYTVTCPEGNYDVFIDMYMCGPGESMR
ncbi:MAG: hypothetical protein IPI49_02830 [Myxococcales bacterium]|nr:hypothetical protein [Myxococcales bacterium]